MHYTTILEQNRPNLGHLPLDQLKKKYFVLIPLPMGPIPQNYLMYDALVSW